MGALFCCAEDDKYVDYMQQVDRQHGGYVPPSSQNHHHRNQKSPLAEQYDWQGRTCEVKQLDASRTIRPTKEHTKGTNRYTLHQKIYRTLNTGEVDFRTLARLPEEENYNEWLAVNVIDFYNEIVLLHGVISPDLCTKNTCPIMNAGRKFTYLWADGKKYKTPTKMSAPEYIYCLLEWVDRQISDERIIPPDDVPYRKDFEKLIKVIFKRLFRIFAHIYHRHYGEYHSLNVAQNLNNAFKRFILFVMEFELIGSEHLAPLQKLIDLATKKKEEEQKKKRSQSE